jgi:hypothetical protein
MAELYFSTIHKWLPVMSRKRFILTRESLSAEQALSWPSYFFM